MPRGSAKMAAVTNVDIVRRVTAAFNRRDVKGVLAQMRPDAQIDWTRSLGPRVGVFSGHDEIAAFLHDTWDVQSTHQFRVDAGLVTLMRLADAES